MTFNDLTLCGIAFLATYNRHKFRLDGVVRFLDGWDWHDLIKESFLFPLVAFFFLKVLEGIFGKAVTFKNIGIWIRKKFKK